MEGSSLASALADAPESFPEIYRASIAAGEQSGRLDRCSRAWRLPAKRATH
jgi:general secretion pathway protein F